MDRLGRFCLGIFPQENDLAYLMLGFGSMCEELSTHTSKSNLTLGTSSDMC